MFFLNRARSSWLVAVSFLILVCCGLAAMGLLSEKDLSESWVRHTNQVQSQLAQARILGLRAEVARRGFALSGDERDLIGFPALRGSAEAQLGMLATMTADNPRQRVNVAALRRATSLRFAGMERTIKLYRSGREDEARQTIIGTPSRDLAVRITQLAQRVDGEEARLLIQRERRAHDEESLARSVLAGGILVILLLGALVWHHRRLQIRALAQANDELATDIRKRELVEAQLQLLATNATDAVFRMGLDGRFHYASPSTRQVFGIDPEAVIGRDITWGVHPDDRSVLTTSMEQLLSGTHERQLVTYRTARPDLPDAWRWIETNAGVVHGSDGQPVEIISSVRDISQRKQLELDLEAARLHAEAAAHAKSSFLANMSHEIRTPMNGVIGFTELLLASGLAADQHRQAELIADSGRAMMRLLNDILDLSKVEAGQMQIADEPLDIRHALRACVRLVTPAVEQKGLTFDIEIADTLPSTIRGDGLRLRQIVLNLLGNAAKFTMHGGITLRARPLENDAGTTLVIEVEDTGLGIAPERRVAIFDSFVQAEASTARRFGGTGLGLPISARLAELMGGRLMLDDADRDGACFVLSLPLVACIDDTGTNSWPSKASPNLAPVPGVSERRGRILVAEDHDVNQLLITAMLRQLGCSPSLAANGTEAIEMIDAAIADSDPYDLVLMDIQMPELDGPEATRRLRARGITPDQLPIVALTANAYADDIALCLSAGMQAHLAKPVTLAGLGEMLDRWSRRSPERIASAPVPIGRKPFRPGATATAKYVAQRDLVLSRVDTMIRQGDVTDGDLEAVAGLLHKLAGTAGMFGEAKLGEVAAEVEEEIVQWPKAERAARALAASRRLRDAD